jgi:tetratricopeptide (TPR) repeat protein
MSKALLLMILSCISLISCQQTDKSNELMKKAMDVYLFSESSEEVKLDSSLSLTNMALKVDDENISAYTHKAMLLFRKKDIHGLLETNSKMLELRPTKPFYLAQRALYYELDGDSLKSEEYYKRAISEYEKYLQQDSLDFNLRLEYIGILESYGDNISASAMLQRMNGFDYSEEQKEILEFYELNAAWKEQLLKFWNGELEYHEIQNKLSE